MDEIAAYQAKERAFLKTPLGSAFHRMKNALARAWQADCNERISDRKLREVWDEAATAEVAFRDLLDEVYRGVLQ